MERLFEKVSTFLMCRQMERLFAGVGSNTLVIMASTRRNLDAVAAVAQMREIWVTAGPLTTTVLASRGVTDCLLSPAGISRRNRGCDQLDRPVVSFPDQVLGDGPSFCCIECGSEKILFSFLEALLVRRHRPTVVSMRHGNRFVCQPEFVDYSAALDGDNKQLLSVLLASVTAEISVPSHDWLAAPYLPFKRLGGLDFVLRESAKDITTLLRCAMTLPETDTVAIDRVLESLKTLRTGRRDHE